MSKSQSETNLELLDFTNRKRGAVKKSSDNLNCVVYTRVSTKEQAETNLSLDTQYKACMAYAVKRGFSVIQKFGGTYESAKNDERKEFKRMLDFVKRSKEAIGYIIVYSVDRFSRSGANAIYIADQLKTLGIKIIAVSQQVDTGTASGVFQQNIQFIFSQYDNDLRREKCIAGMREKLLQGQWMGATPTGFNLMRVNGEQKITPNETGKLIAKAFLWKAEERLNHTEISVRLESMGVKLSEKRLTEIFRNPFYCGYISHSMLNGEIVKGKHEALVSQQTFLKVNNLLKENPQGFSQKKADAKLPLKKFISCSACETTWTGYLVKKKGKYYYKCNRKGCKCNKNAEKMHELFIEYLKSFSSDPKNHEPLTMQLKLTFEYMNKQNESNHHLLDTKLKEANDKLHKVQERFALGEIDKEIYDRVSGKLKEEKEAVERESANAEIKLSNLDKYADHTMQMAENLGKMWDSPDFSVQQHLQYLLFPEGVSYDWKNHVYRTPKVNSVFTLIAGLSRDYEEKKVGQIDLDVYLSDLVPRVGIEPTNPKILVFETNASTSSAIGAITTFSEIPCQFLI